MSWTALSEKVVEHVYSLWFKAAVDVFFCGDDEVIHGGDIAWNLCFCELAVLHWCRSMTTRTCYETLRLQI